MYVLLNSVILHSISNVLGKIDVHCRIARTEYPSMHFLFVLIKVKIKKYYNLSDNNKSFQKKREVFGSVY